LTNSQIHNRNVPVVENVLKDETDNVDIVVQVADDDVNNNDHDDDDDVATTNNTVLILYIGFITLG
jgi:hypothetical protein